MKAEQIYHIITSVALIIALGLLIKPVCNEPKLPTPPRDSIITIINEKTKYDSVLVDHWHKAIHITDSVIKLVYLSAPDTCQPYITQIVVAYQNERDSVAKVVNNKDSIIVQYNALSILDSTSISNLQNDTTTLRNKLNKKRYGFAIGYALGLGTGIIINSIK
jgi:ABC-type antimicrobial peptide transport system ATPase subunit